MKADLFNRCINEKLDRIIKSQKEHGAFLRKIIRGTISEESLSGLAKTIRKLKRISKKV